MSDKQEVVLSRHSSLFFKASFSRGQTSQERKSHSPGNCKTLEDLKGDAMRSLPARLLLTALFVGLLSCAAYANTTINKINADPGRYQNKKVTIEGTVTDSYGAWREGAYEIDDGTGRIWVVSSDRIVPAKGAHIE